MSAPWYFIEKMPAQMSILTLNLTLVQNIQFFHLTMALVGLGAPSAAVCLVDDALRVGRPLDGYSVVSWEFMRTITWTDTFKGLEADE